MCVVTSEDEAERRGLRPLLRLRSWAVAGVGPEVMGIGPVPATALALERAGLSMADLDLIELNEAFAAQVLAVLREWRLPDDRERVNVNGSGISLGHPVGATGARILATLAYNFGGSTPAPAAEPVVEPAPPPAPETPALQTCPSGHVILATETCPVVEPTAPVTAGERG